MGETDVRSSVRSGDVLAWCGLLIAAAALAARYLPVVNHTILIIGAASPYLTTIAAMSAVLLLANRRRRSAALAVLLLAAAVITPVRNFTARNVADDCIPIRVLTANLHDGEADPESVAAAARTNADLLFVQELTPQLAETLNGDYFTSDFPHRFLQPGRYGAGVGFWSRYPIVGSRSIPGFALGALTATVHPPGTGGVVVATVHLAGPWPQPIDLWRAEIAALPETLNQLAAAAGPRAAVAAGDLNATADLKPFRRLLDTGFRDAGRLFGLAATWPAESPMSPVIGIDHVLTYNSTTTDAHAVRIAGSDHLALAATVWVPRNP